VAAILLFYSLNNAKELITSTNEYRVFALQMEAAWSSYHITTPEDRDVTSSPSKPQIGNIRQNMI